MNKRYLGSGVIVPVCVAYSCAPSGPRCQIIQMHEMPMARPYEAGFRCRLPGEGGDVVWRGRPFANRKALHWPLCTCANGMYCGFPSSCNAKRHALYKHVRAQLFISGFSVTTTDSQDFKHAYTHTNRQPQNITGVVKELRILTQY